MNEEPETGHEKSPAEQIYKVNVSPLPTSIKSINDLEAYCKSRVSAEYESFEERGPK